MQKTVVVTGASTGIGFNCVRILTENNFQVVATVRKESDKLNLEKSFGKNVKVVLLDVSDFAEVEKLPAKLKNDFQISELHGLVNNAGVAYAGAFAYQDFNEVRDVININVLALMKVTQVLLPMLGMETNSRGRIVNISSVAGKVPTPFLSVYAASKHAVEGFSIALRQELKIKNMHVSVVGPGSIKTPIWEKGFERIKDHYAKTIYGEAFQIFINFAMKQVDHALPPEAVSKCILHALTSECPKRRYTPIPQKWLNWYLPKLLPAKAFDKIVANTLKIHPK
jgi:short-subunit dehydrogenase